MYFSRPITPEKIDKTSTDAAISLIFIRGNYQKNSYCLQGIDINNL
jgi:hypothetical protein